MSYDMSCVWAGEALKQTNIGGVGGIAYMMELFCAVHFLFTHQLEV